VLVSSLLDCIPLPMPDAGQPPPVGGEQSCSFADVLWAETEQAPSEGEADTDTQRQPSTDTVLPFMFVHSYVPVEAVPVASLSLDIPEPQAVEAAAPEKIVLAPAPPVVAAATETVEPHANPEFEHASEPVSPPTVPLDVDIPERGDLRVTPRVDEEPDVPEQPYRAPAPAPSDVAAAPPVPPLRATTPVDAPSAPPPPTVHKFERAPEQPDPVEHHAQPRAPEPVATMPHAPDEPSVTAFTGRLEVTDSDPVLEPAPASHETTAAREQPVHVDPRPAPVQPRVEQAAVPHRPAEVAAPAPVRSPELPVAPAPSTPIQRLHVRVETPSNETISLHFTQRHEAIDVGVRTSSDQVAQTLRAELPQLADGLRREGIHSQFQAPQPVQGIDVIEVAPPDVVMTPAAGATHVMRETPVESNLSGEREHTYHEAQDQPQQHSRRHKNTQEDEEVDE
jgi:hypothetical protein